MNATEALIRLERITKVFHTDEVETHALSEVHLEIKPGEFVSIAGPSGCGKSTLLSILGLLDSPTGGDYWIHRDHVQHLSIIKSHTYSQSRDRIHFPGIQLDW